MGEKQARADTLRADTLFECKKQTGQKIKQVDTLQADTLLHRK